MTIDDEEVYSKEFVSWAEVKDELNSKAEEFNQKREEADDDGLGWEWMKHDASGSGSVEIDVPELLHKVYENLQPVYDSVDTLWYGAVDLTYHTQRLLSTIKMVSYLRVPMYAHDKHHEFCASVP